MRYRAIRSDSLMLNERAQVEGDYSALSDTELAALAPTGASIDQFKRDLEEQRYFLLTDSPHKPLFSRQSTQSTKPALLSTRSGGSHTPVHNYIPEVYEIPSESPEYPPLFSRIRQWVDQFNALTDNPASQSYKKENIIFIGSETYYDSFWLKMMFIGAAMAAVNQQLRSADRNVIAYVANGYTKLELGVIEHLSSSGGFISVKLNSSADIITLFNRERKKYKLQDVYFFSHGAIDLIDLNYKGDSVIAIISSSLSAIQKDIFLKEGKIYSYACRTGISARGDSFKNDAAAQPNKSLAQNMANHFGIKVYAFLTRSHYGNILRQRSQSTEIIEQLKLLREQHGDYQTHSLSAEHEALPHQGLGGIGAFREGSKNYALWRKQGGRELPVSGAKPEGLSRGMKLFTPAKQT